MPHTMQTIWTWESRRNGFPHTGPLWLSPVLWSQELFEEIEDPAEAISRYRSMIQTDYPTAREVPLSWQVADLGERAPFQTHKGEVDGMSVDNGLFAGDDFLHYCTWPKSQASGEQVDWYQLPVRPGRGARMWESFDWLPLPLQRTISVDVLGLLDRRARRAADPASEPRASEKQRKYLADLLRKAGHEPSHDELAGLSKAEAGRRISSLVDQQDA